MTETKPSNDKFPACMENTEHYVERWSKFSIKDRNAMVMKLNNNGLGLILAGIATFGGLFGALNGGGHMAAGAAFGAAFGGSFGLIGGVNNLLVRYSILILKQAISLDTLSFLNISNYYYKIRRSVG